MSTPAKLEAIARLLSAVERRERLASALWGLSRVALPAGLLIAALAVGGQHLCYTHRASFAHLLWASLLPLLGVLVWAGFRPVDRRALARRVDAFYGTHDAIGNAMEFSVPGVSLCSRDERASSFAQMAIRRGIAAVEGKDPRRVVPLEVPGLRRVDLLAALLLACSFLLPVRNPAPIDSPLATAAPLAGDELEDSRGIDMALADPLREQMRGLRDAKEAVPQKVAEEILEVLDALEHGEIDRATALERLAELEEELARAELEMEAAEEEDPGILGEGMRELGEALREHEIAQDVSDALARQDPEAAEKAMKEAFDKAETDTGAREAMEQAMKDAERALGRAADEKSDTAAKLAEAERRLKRQQKRPEADPEEQERRLKKKKEDVERLQRQHEKEKAAQRELERLRRKSQQSRSGSQGGQSKQKRKDAQQQMSQGMRDAMRKASQSRKMSAARDGLEEAKSFVRRSGKQGEKDSRRKQQQKAFSKAAKGKKGKKGEPSMLIEGEVGDGPPDSVMMDGGDQPGEGEGEGEGESEGEGEGEGQSSSPGDAPGGDGIGEGSMGALGDESGLATKKRDVHVSADQGRGATRAQIIEQASQDGFANEGYRRVYQDYRGFAQDAIDNESMPPSQRRRIKRYYQMIQPRD